MKHVNIVGAGFSGMSLAYFLRKQGVQVTIHEKKSRTGGLIQTRQFPEGIAETAANSFISTDLSSRLFEDLGIEPCAPKKTATKRYIYNGRPTQWPLSFKETFAALKGAFKNLLLGRGSHLPRPHESVLDWGSRVLSPAFSQKIISPAFQGIYASSADQLSASIILGPLFNKKKKKSRKRYKGLLTAPEGMGQVLQSLEQHLRNNGVTFNLDVDINIANLQGPVVLCTSANQAQSLLKETLPDLSQELAQVPMVSIITTTVFLKSDTKPYHGFGCLIPKSTFSTMGVLFNSDIFEHRDKSPNETWILSPRLQENLLQLSDEEILYTIQKERAEILGVSEEFLNFSITRWDKALPLYGTTLEDLWNRGKLHQTHENITLHGNYLHGIGLSKILEGSKSLAERLTHG